MELQASADAMLKTLGVTMQSGSITLHFDQGRVQKVETHLVHRPQKHVDMTHDRRAE